MLFVHNGNRRTAVPSICRTLCVLAAWVQVGTALPQAATDNDAAVDGFSTEFALIPSGPKTGSIPSASPPPENAQTALIPSQQPGLIPSQPPVLIPSQPPPQLIPSQLPEPIPSASEPAPVLIPSEPPSTSSSQPGGLIPSGTLPGLIPSQSQPGLIPSGPIPSQTGIIPSLTQPSGISPTLIGSDAPPMPTEFRSTDEPLKPIPAPTTAPGDPNGHHEISEPDFSTTAPCRGCSPVVEISVTGFDDWPRTTAIAEHMESPAPSAIPDHVGFPSAETPQPPKATITAGPSDKPTEIEVIQQPTGGNLVIGLPEGSTTVTPGQTVTYDKTPIVIQTSEGKTEVIVGGTATIPFTVTPAIPFLDQITSGPLLSPITIGKETITADSSSQFIVSGQTLQPGASAITVDGTTVSLLPSASAIVVNGVTSTLTQIYGAVYTTTAAGILTINNQVYTANRVGYYVVAPGTTLVPGGSAITVSGTTISLEPKGTAAIIQGQTSSIRPVTTIVTLTRSGNSGYGGAGLWTSAIQSKLPAPTGSHSSGNMVRVSASLSADGWLEGLFMLGFLGLGWLAVWL